MNNSTTATCQLIGGDGTFNVNGIESFGKEVNWATCGRSYVIVSIFGPQNSGKSTLLNHLFGTNFKEMDARKGRSATTKGIWLARSCDGMEQPLTIAMDVEGADSQEREDDTAFEKQSALFALAVSDIVLINMWYNDIGRRNAACNPLLETVFQVMRRLFKARRITLIFVIRDMTTMTPFETIKPVIEENIQKIWDSVSKAPTQEHIPLSQLFEIKVVALSHYEHETKKFKEKVDSLRQQIKHSIAPGGFVEDRDKVVPASSLPLSMQHIWKTIKENKDLNLPAVKVMVSNIRCQEIADEKYRKFTQNQDWLELKVASQSGLASKFGEKLNSIIVHCLCEYDLEVADYDGDIRTKTKKKLEHDLIELVEPAVESSLRHLRLNSVKRFKELFNESLKQEQGFSAAFNRCKDICVTHFAEGCTVFFENLAQCFDAQSHCNSPTPTQSQQQPNAATLGQAQQQAPPRPVQQHQHQIPYPFVEQWHANSNVSRARSKLVSDIYDYMATVRLSKLAEVTSLYEARLSVALIGPVSRVLLDTTNDKAWPSIKEILQREIHHAETGLAEVFIQFDLDEQMQKNMRAKLEDYARSVVEAKAREHAQNISSLMKARFISLFSLEGHVQREWTENTNIESITKIAHYACLKLLSALAAIQLDDKFEDLEKYLVALLDDKFEDLEKYLVALFHDKCWEKVQALTSTSWNKIPLSETVITPLQCLLLWEKFLKETNPFIVGAIAEATEHKREKVQRRRRRAKLSLNIVQVVTNVTLTILGGGPIFSNN